MLTNHFFHRACEPNHGVCSFPSAHVQLTKRHQLLKFGQRYRVYLNLDMPESPKNKNLGLYFTVLKFVSDHNFKIILSNLYLCRNVYGVHHNERQRRRSAVSFLPISNASLQKWAVAHVENIAVLALFPVWPYRRKTRRKCWALCRLWRGFRKISSIWVKRKYWLKLISGKASNWCLRRGP